MNDADLEKLATLVADKLAARIGEPQRHPEPPAPKWLKLEAFRARWSLSKSALYERLAEGLPNEGEGRRRRIPVEAGDEWMRSHGGRRAA